MGALKRLKGEICRGADRGRKWHGLLLPGGSILLTYSVPMRPFTHSLNAPPHTHIQNPPISFFIFSKFLWLCSNIDIKKKKKDRQLLSPGWDGRHPAVVHRGSSAANLGKKKKKRLQGPFTVAIQQRGDTVADVLFKCLFKRGDSACERIQPWRFGLHVELF